VGEAVHENRPLEESRVTFGKCLMRFGSEYFIFSSCAGNLNVSDWE